MPSNLKLPPTVEIKRVIAAVERAGIEIGSIEIERRKITIHPRDPGNSQGLGAYDLWKMSQGQNTDRVKYGGEKSDALSKKPRR